MLFKSEYRNPSSCQLIYLMKGFCSKSHIGELEEWTASKTVIPEDEKAAFILNKDIDHENKKFRFVLSSRRLLSVIGKLRILAADCTFKTTLEGYPLLVVCMVDEMRHAHPVAFATITNQTHDDYTFIFRAIKEACLRLGISINVEYFISDGEIALKSAATLVFATCKPINCYFHFRENLKKHLRKSSLEEGEKAAIEADVSNMQIAPTQQHFVKATALFIEKHNDNTELITFFRKYVENVNFSGWHEAFSPGVPSTNNAIEAINKSIKYNYLHRKKEPLGIFKEKICLLVESYGDPAREIHRSRIFSLQEERKAFECINSGKTVRTMQFNQKKYFFLPGRGRTDLTKQEIEKFNQPEFTTFEQFVTEQGTVCRVEASNENYLQWNCTCFKFFKSNVCHHIVVAAVKQGVYNLRPEADTSIISIKKATGRPKFVTKALVRD